MLALHRNVYLLLAAQALIGSTGPLVVFIGGFIGIQLAPSATLATLPISCMIAGIAVFTYPVIRLMSHLGRKRGFVFTTVFGVLNCLFAAFAIEQHSFWLLCTAIFLFGVPLAANQQCRFAAMESVRPEQAGTAVSVLLLAGLVAAFIGPEIGALGHQLLTSPFSASFLLLAVAMLTALAFIAGLVPTDAQFSSAQQPPRAIGDILRQPLFWVALSAAACGFAVMSFIMTATPISMHVHHHYDMQQTKVVIQSHIVAMYLPSLFGAWLIQRIGAIKMLVIGIIAMFICLLIGLAGQQYVHYWLALVLLGVGWNFMFVSGTTLLPRCYQPEEKYRVQGINDLSVFASQAVASLSAGLVLTYTGWHGILGIAAVMLVLPVTALIIWQRRGSELPEPRV